jgi:hypothetical protein
VIGFLAGVVVGVLLTIAGIAGWIAWAYRKAVAGC